MVIPGGGIDMPGGGPIPGGGFIVNNF
jgi:hypothetical protein